MSVPAKRREISRAPFPLPPFCVQMGPEQVVQFPAAGWIIINRRVKWTLAAGAEIAGR